ncbi:hypothetical protein AVEN_55848-1 [Araneus ventricosus]|uniref:Uncharacterized protein n=1 Tax=Araneus ventricosus TaxID=182803 RepID=A0A4Y2CN28_ARAVE|nr:hypothetical protein AVEN_55848-1 [Araneus ventricosus]
MVQYRGFISKHPDLVLGRAVHLNNSRCDSSSAEAGVAMVVTDHGRTFSVGGTHYHWQRGPNRYCTLQGSETPLTYLAASHPCTRPSPRGPNTGDVKAFTKPFPFWFFSL